MASGHALNPRRQDMAIIERRDAVVELRRQRPRPSWKTIGERLGITAATARTDYLEALMLTTEHTAELADVERVEQLEMTDKVIDRLTPYVLDERFTKAGVDAGPSLESLDRLIRVLDHRAKLTGAYAPAKVAQTDSKGNDKYAEGSLDQLRDLAIRIAATTDPTGDGAGQGGSEVYLAPARAPEPIAAEWDVVHMAAADGAREREDEDGGRDDAGACRAE